MRAASRRRQYAPGNRSHSFLTAFYKPLREFGRGGNQEALNCEIVANWAVALPPVNEQWVICDFLKSETDRLREAQAAIGRQIENLREYRRCLIADVVTGKLDVREAGARLPAESSDDEPFDGNEASTEDAEAEDRGDDATEEAAAALDE